MSFLWPPGEVSVELEAWGEEVLSAGELVCQGEEEASFAAGAGAGHGGQEEGDDDHVSGDDDQVVEEVGTWLDFEDLRLGFGGASGFFPQRLFCVL